MVHPTRLHPPLIETCKTTLEERPISYTLKRSPRAKHVRLEVRGKTGLTVVIPTSYDMEQLPDLLVTKRRWILGKLAKYGKAEALSAGKGLKSGDSIPYLGQPVKVVVRLNPMAIDGIKLERKRLLLDLSARNARLNLVVEWWYRQQAERLIRRRAGELCSRLGVTYGRLTIRGAKTRWGSCSQKGNLNFNWRLMMVPEPVIDYVIIHELAHLKENNHSKKFWELVAEHCPRWRKHRKWLKDHEAELAARLPA